MDRCTTRAIIPFWYVRLFAIVRARIETETHIDDNIEKEKEPLPLLTPISSIVSDSSLGIKLCKTFDR